MFIPFDNSYAALPPTFYSAQVPTPVRAPRLLAWNADLAAILGIDAEDLDEAAEVFAGNALPSGAAPLAQLYAGHQFGNFTPQLGDGRAILLGEVIGCDGQRRDIQLKGAGPTPYSRRGDGRAWLGPVLREYVVSEAMHALGIPTTRALAAVATGEPVWREQGGLPGAVLTRIAASHLRVGSFQVFASRGEIDALRILTDYALARHYPDANGWQGLLRAVCGAQARLIPAWMSVGFIHGVMNTDNSSISGETIDYGPCAFMDAYHEGQVFSSIDHQGRYAYGNQPRIAVWNAAQFATALIQQADDPAAAVEEATEIVHAMPALLQDEWRARFGRKLGLEDAALEDEALIEDFLAQMQDTGADFTNTFHALATDQAAVHFTDQARFSAWRARWQARLAKEANPKEVMGRANPAIIPRNHQIEHMIAAAVSGDMTPFERLTQALATPFTDHPELSHPPTEEQRVTATFCGT